MKQLLSAILLLQILFTGCYDHHSAPKPSENEQIVTATITDLYEMCNGSQIIQIKSSISTHGVVVSSDSQSFINKAIYIDDGTATAKISIDMSQISSLYPIGSKLTISLNGLVLTIRNYQLHIAMLDNDDPTEIKGIKSEVLLDRHISCESRPYTVEPQVVLPYELNSLLCGKLVHLEGMMHSPTDEADSYIAGGFHRFSNLRGDHTYIYIDQYSSAFGKPLPTGEVTLTGIVTWYPEIYGEKNTIALLPRYKSDIGM